VVYVVKRITCPKVRAMVPWWFMPNALVTGNTYALELSEQVTMPQNRILEVIDEYEASIFYDGSIIVNTADNSSNHWKTPPNL